VVAFLIGATAACAGEFQSSASVRVGFFPARPRFWVPEVEAADEGGAHAVSKSCVPTHAIVAAV
jgi:hypothetical protein